MNEKTNENIAKMLIGIINDSVLTTEETAVPTILGTAKIVFKEGFSRHEVVIRVSPFGFWSDVITFKIDMGSGAISTNWSSGGRDDTDENFGTFCFSEWLLVLRKVADAAHDLDREAMIETFNKTSNAVTTAAEKVAYEKFLAAGYEKITANEVARMLENNQNERYIHIWDQVLQRSNRALVDIDIKDNKISYYIDSRRRLTRETFVAKLEGSLHLYVGN